MKKLNKKFIYGTGSVALIAGVCVIIILLNLISGMLAENFGMKVDVTETKILDFSDEFVDIIKSVDKDIEIYFLVNPEDMHPDNVLELQDYNYLYRIKQILEKVESMNSHIKLTITHPDKNPEIASKFGTVNIEDVIFSCGDKHNSMPATDIQSYDNNGNKAIVAEEKFASMISSVMREEKIKVGFVTGHNEEDTSPIKSVLDVEGVEYSDFNIMIDGISDEYDLIFIYGPKVDFSVDEINRIEEYLASGHNMQVHMDRAKDCMNLAEYLSQLGLGYDVNSAYIEEKDPQHIISGYLVPYMIKHTVTNTISNNLVIPYAISVAPLWESKNSIDTSPMLYTSDKATLYANQSAVGSYCVMTISSRITESQLISHVIASGSSYIFNEGVMNYNKPLLVNSVLWMGKSSENISILSKPISNNPLEITVDQYWTWQMIFTFVIPFIIIIIGLFVWIKRRFL